MPRGLTTNTTPATGALSESLIARVMGLNREPSAKKKTTTTKKKATVEVPKEAPALLSLEESVAKAIDTIKKSDYKGTHIKVELEAHMARSWDEDECDDWLLENVSEEAKKSLVYSRFYNDGSVDSEFTFTVPIDKPYVVLEFIKAFKDLAKEAGSTFETTGAGMHIAILNSGDGNYPQGNVLSESRVDNFRASMTSLLPALYFLGSSNATTRRLSFREPRVCGGRKYSAINNSSRVFEYRVFDTCYDKPEMFLDYFCVIAKTMQFYKTKQVVFPFFGTIGKLVLNDDGYHLSRFYTTIKHLEALELGLAILKPDHKTIEQLKKERSFNLDKEVLEKKEEKLVLKWKAEIPSEKKKLEMLEKRMRKNYDSYCKREMELGYMTEEQAKNFTENSIKDWRKNNYGHLDNEEAYINKKRQDHVATTNGRVYTLTV